MGNHDLGRVIGTLVQIAYERRLRDEAALDILDRFCMGRGGDAEWEAEDPRRPGLSHPEILDYTDPHPAAGLGMLMVEAFAPNGLNDLPRYRGVMGYKPTGVSETDRELELASEIASDRWSEEVYRPFMERYGFW